MTRTSRPVGRPEQQRGGCAEVTSDHRHPSRRHVELAVVRCAVWGGPDQLAAADIQMDAITDPMYRDIVAAAIDVVGDLACTPPRRREVAIPGWPAVTVDDHRTGTMVAQVVDRLAATTGWTRARAVAAVVDLAVAGIGTGAGRVDGLAYHLHLLGEIGDRDRLRHRLAGLADTLERPGGPARVARQLAAVGP